VPARGGARSRQRRQVDRLRRHRQRALDQAALELLQARASPPSRARALRCAPRTQEGGKFFRIGMAAPVSAELNAAYLAAFRQELQRLGYVEGRNLVIEHRSADGDASRFPALLTELIALNVDLIVARGTPAALAAKKATSTIPVLMAVGEPLLVVADEVIE
jgi:hypothetical protein